MHGSKVLGTRVPVVANRKFFSCCEQAIRLATARCGGVVRAMLVLAAAGSMLGGLDHAAADETLPANEMLRRGAALFREHKVKEAADWFRKAAELGDPTAQSFLAKIYLEGQKGVPRDYHEAMKWFKRVTENRAASVGRRTEALRAIGIMYAKGLGVKQDGSAAVNSLEAAAKQGDRESALLLGGFYRDGAVINRDARKAELWYRQAPTVDALLQLASMYYKGEGVTEDKGIAYEWMRRAMRDPGREGRRAAAVVVPILRRDAKAGDKTARAHLGSLMVEGRRVERDVAEGMKLLTKSAQQGDPYAQCELGKLTIRRHHQYDKGREWLLKAAHQGYANAMFELGRSYDHRVDGDGRKVLQWYRQAAEKGSVEAKLRLGEPFFLVKGVKVSDEETVKWLREVAELEFGDQKSQRATAQELLIKKARTGNSYAATYVIKNASPKWEPSAQFKLGQAYEATGHDEQAVHWYRQAADKGDGDAQLEMGFRFFEGRGVKRDFSKAYHLLNEGELGQPLAQVYVGAMYAGGKGVEQDDEEALNWFRKAQKKESYFVDIMTMEQSDVVALSARSVNPIIWKDYSRGSEKINEVSAAFLRLSDMYMTGTVVPKDTEKASRLLVGLALRGQAKTADGAKAAYRIAEMFETGSVLPRNPSKAVVWGFKTLLLAPEGKEGASLFKKASALASRNALQLAVKIVNADSVKLFGWPDKKATVFATLGRGDVVRTIELDGDQGEWICAYAPTGEHQVTVGFILKSRLRNRG